MDDSKSQLALEGIRGATWLEEPESPMKRGVSWVTGPVSLHQLLFTIRVEGEVAVDLTTGEAQNLKETWYAVHALECQ